MVSQTGVLYLPRFNRNTLLLLPSERRRRRIRERDRKLHLLLERTKDLGLLVLTQRSGRKGEIIILFLDPCPFIIIITKITDFMHIFRENAPKIGGSIILYDGSISRIDKCVLEYTSAKFHAFNKKCTIFALAALLSCLIARCNLP